MATLNLIIASTGEVFEIHGLDLSTHTPQDILDQSAEIGLLTPPAGGHWTLLNDSVPISDPSKTFELLSIKDGDKLFITVKAGMCC